MARRADAQANRGRILDAAETVFGAGGQSASTEEVARLAGVGIATVFRHFPTKTALLEAVLVRHFERLRDLAATLLAEHGPGTAFFELFTCLVLDAPTKIAIAEALAETGAPQEGEVARVSAELRSTVGSSLRQAQEAGTVRDDVELPEVYSLLVAISRTAADAEVRERMLAITFDGLSPR
jgi:AcrR family transcriptional regulator